MIHIPVYCVLPSNTALISAFPGLPMTCGYGLPVDVCVLFSRCGCVGMIPPKPHTLCYSVCPFFTAMGVTGHIPPFGLHSFSLRSLGFFL